MFKYVFISICFSMSLWATCQNPKFIMGKGSVNEDGKILEVNTGRHTIIEWDDFSVDEDESVYFNQTNDQSAVLNRIIGDDRSYIYGNLYSNGKVFIVNPKGIIIGEDSYINVNSFIASGLDVINDEFMVSDEYLNYKGNGNHSLIINLGKIEAKEGDVFLIGPHTCNKGVIQAEEGQVGLIAAQEVLIRPKGEDNRILIKPSENEKIKEKVGVVNNGYIESPVVELFADGSLYSTAIKHEGTIDARGVKKDNSHVYLVAKEGEVQIFGTIYAEKREGIGGDVYLLGKDVEMKKTAEIYISAEKQGGKLLIGGDFRGKNPKIYNAESCSVSGLVDASAYNNGKGGHIIVWANKNVYYDGQFIARGGEESGNGGFIYISGKEDLKFAGTVDLRALNGVKGNLHLGCKAISVLDIKLPGREYYINEEEGFSISGGFLRAACLHSSILLETDENIYIDDNVLRSIYNKDVKLQAGKTVVIKQTD